MGTNVPSPTFGANGFVAPLESQILAGVQADLQAAFGGKLNFTTSGGSQTNSTPQSQLAMSLTAIIGNVNDTFLNYTQQVDPAYAEGRMQDGIGRIYFITRIAGQPTVLQVACNGGQNVVIPVGATIQDPATGNIFTAVQAGGTIPGSGSVTIAFSCNTIGPVAVPATVVPYQTISGWDSCTVISGTVGNLTENRAAFEARRKQSVANNARGFVSAIQGAVLAVAGVVDAYTTENATNNPVTVGSGNGAYTLAANSLYVAAVGGSASDIAQAIWSKKAPGCSYNGNTTVTVYDTNSGYSQPLPSYQVTFEVPPFLPIFFKVILKSNPSLPSNATSLVQQAIINAFSGNVDNVPRANIASSIVPNDYISALIPLGTWVRVLSITAGSLNNPDVGFNGSISGSVLTVTSISSGTLSVGQFITDATNSILPGTFISSPGTGTGGTGTYNLSTSQTVPSEAMSAISANLDQIQVGIAQEPSINASNISVTIQ